MARAGIGLAVALWLGGCGPMGDAGLAGNLAQAVLPASVGQVLPKPPQKQARSAGSGADFSLEAIAAAPENYMAFELRSVGMQGLGTVAGRNDGKVTWISDADFGVTFENGLLVATRGLGEDLMAADVSQVWAAFVRGGGEAQRVHEMLDSRDRIVRQTFDCTIAATGVEPVDLGLRQIETLRFDENCTSGSVVFRNMYWIDETASIVQSVQLVSPTVAYLRSNRF